MNSKTKLTEFYSNENRALQVHPWQFCNAAHKTQTTSVTQHQNNHTFKPSFNNTEIEDAATSDILGIKFDSGMNFESHIKEIVRKGVRN